VSPAPSNPPPARPRAIVGELMLAATSTLLVMARAP
jgi:hypothetical protein